MKPVLLVLAGPTASGKTALSIEFAKHFKTEIISCDARQFYREMNIGTAKPTEPELQSVKHHFIDNLTIFDNYSVGDYEKEVLSFLNEYFQNNKIALMVGGSGLFMRTVCEGVDEFPDIPPNFRAELQTLFNEKGIEVLQKELKEKDPEYYTKVDLKNPHRLIRALEVCRFSGKPYTSFLGKGKVSRPFQVVKIGLNWDKQTLHHRINERVDKMMAEGLLKEAESLYEHKNLNALQTVGYQELFSYFEGKFSMDEAVEQIKLNTRHYAKRQMTWFKKEKDMIWFNMPVATKEIIREVEKNIV
jgi:tRNA dimethylallyltransferase